MMACDTTGAELLSACGAKLGTLRLDLEHYLDQQPTTGGDDLEQAVAFQAALQRAASHAQSSGREQITMDGFLAALLLEKTTYAVAMLARHRVTRLAVTTHISHGAPHRVAVQALPKARLLGHWRPAPRGTPDRYEIVLHNDDFTTREFVIWLLTSLFERSREDAEALMQEVHACGTGSAGVYPLREANRLVERATEVARSAEFPLRMSIIPAA
jgi:ATP-dependent Clp protease adapter protein ClpS